MRIQNLDTPLRDDASSTFNVIREFVDRARAAQRVYERFSQERLDETVTGVGWAILEPSRNRTLAELAVADSGLGVVRDKIIKNNRKTLGLLRDVLDAKSTGVIAEYPEIGITEIARPVGVVAAIVPSTNPSATPINNIINALKCGNAIILAPSPKGHSTVVRLLEFVHCELNRVGAPRDLVQVLPTPVSKVMSLELMHQVDLVVVTGSQSNVRAGYASGTPTLGVGVGNVAVIVDDSADVNDAAFKIISSKTFDNATSCSSENSLVIHDSVYAAMLSALKRAGGVLLTPVERIQLTRTMFPEGKLSPAVIAQSVTRICEVAGLTRPELVRAKCLMVEETGIGPMYPFSGEKLSPVMTLYRAHSFEDAVATVRRIYDFMGNGHSCGIYSESSNHVMRLGCELTICRVIVKQAHCFATGGSFDNGLPFSLSMGCGTWGRNSFSENLNYRHFMNITRIVRQIPPREPTLADITGRYREKYHV